MNKRQENFCYHYAASGNGYESAVKAGYSKKSAKQQAYRLLTNDYLNRKIDEIRKEVISELKIEVKDIIYELSKIAFSNMSDVISIVDEGRVILKPDADLSVLKSIASSETRSGRSFAIKLDDRLLALKEIAKLIGAYEKKPENNSRDREANADSILESLTKLIL